jgi:hypothetical protein
MQVFGSTRCAESRQNELRLYVRSGAEMARPKRCLNPNQRSGLTFPQPARFCKHIDQSLSCFVAAHEVLTETTSNFGRVNPKD